MTASGAAVRSVVLLALIWGALLFCFVLWTLGTRKLLHLSDLWSVWGPLAVIFAALLLRLLYAPLWRFRRGLQMLTSIGVACLLTFLSAWLWFIVVWSVMGGSAP